MSDRPPYLSVVATSRNDDHGVNLLRRTQIFVDALAQQAERFSLPMELVLVDWNPPADKPPLASALRWPGNPEFCRFRVLTVPPEIHRRYRHHQHQPLYQMIGKNVGIRRSRGEFILATNIDIVFNNELMEFLASRALDKARMYRIDRTDVAADVPLGVPVDEQLAYCESHRLRLNTRGGTFALAAEEVRRLAPLDVAKPGQGVFFGPGWFLPEQYFGRIFRWAGREAALAIDPSPVDRTLQFDLESGPAIGFRPFVLRTMNEAGGVAAETAAPFRARVRVRIPANAMHLRFDAAPPGESGANSRLPHLRVFGFRWLPAAVMNGAPLTAAPAPRLRLSRGRELAVAGRRFFRDLRRREGPIGIGLPFSFGGNLRLHDDEVGLSIAIGPESLATSASKVEAADLHTNACGDFTLVHRDVWMDLRGYPEFDLYSMHIDSIFCYMAHHAGAREQVLCDPMRIYHIEHSSGSGWSPEGESLLFGRLAAKGVGWIEYEKAMSWASDMARFDAPLIFNREDWGLGGFDAPEIDPSHTSDAEKRK